jgi:hypothetical protein
MRRAGALASACGGRGGGGLMLAPNAGQRGLPACRPVGDGQPRGACGACAFGTGCMRSVRPHDAVDFCSPTIDWPGRMLPPSPSPPLEPPPPHAPFPVLLALLCLARLGPPPPPLRDARSPATRLTLASARRPTAAEDAGHQHYRRARVRIRSRVRMSHRHRPLSKSVRARVFGCGRIPMQLPPEPIRPPARARPAVGRASETACTAHPHCRASRTGHLWGAKPRAVRMQPRNVVHGHRLRAIDSAAAAATARTRQTVGVDMDAQHACELTDSDPTDVQTPRT